ncbi:MAG: MerR family transcriptional regulator [Chloroflexota bacterium]|jgi:MerR family transcriptional regulator/heat shock protein HspR
MARLTKSKLDQIRRLLDKSLVREGGSEPRYVISVAARMVGIEPHTLRYYERLGLVRPRRSGGNIRLYSQEDVEHLCRVRALMNDLGLNIAGVEVALHLLDRLKEMQNEMQQLQRELDGSSREGEKR